MMESANYGRMALGRCVDKDFGHLGCSADVLEKMDNICSGRPKCDISNIPSSLHSVEPCPKALASYLQAAYTCTEGTCMEVHYWRL